jgi:two-component system NtrC family sensor kinase
MKSSLRTKLIATFLIVIAVSGIVTVMVGIRLIGDGIIRQAQDKVRIDLNSAREVYRHNLDGVREVVRLTAVRFFLKESLLIDDPEAARAELERVRTAEGLDVLNLTDRNGVVIFRTRNPGVRGDSQAEDPLVARVLLDKEVAAATEIVSAQELAEEGADLAERAHIGFVPTRMARPTTATEETSGMVLKAAAPVLDYDGNLIGVLCGAKLLNRNYEIVDAVKAIVYQGETYKGKDTGTATIFQGDLRISTNVRGPDGERAIGTRVSQQVYDQVIVKGVPWVARAFVVSDWYITAYEPIRDVEGKIIGMLYVGMLEAPYRDLRNRVVVTFSAIAALTVVLLSVVMYFSTSSIIRPLRGLLHATQRIAAGHLETRVEAESEDELGQLAGSFNTMTAELQKSRDEYVALTRTLEDKVHERTRQLEETRDRLVQSEKMSSLGKMAAGIAHEINNPLTSILINSHLIAETLHGTHDLDENLKLIIDETTRCSTIVKGLLEFSRQTRPEMRPADINQVVEDTLLLMKSHILASKSEVTKDLGRGLPAVSMDANKIKQVFANIILNALEAMPQGGRLTIGTRLSEDGRELRIGFQDTGCGIPDDVMAKIFDPFFSTKETRGTGLGLAISYGIVEQHGGRIDVWSKVGKGTTVTIVLPVGKGMAEAS